jgi:hypothetical protein
VLYPLSYEGRAHPRHQGKVEEHSEVARATDWPDDQGSGAVLAR